MSWPGSPRDRGFKRLGDDMDDDGPYVDKQSAGSAAKAAPLAAAAGGGDAKRKKHYLKFLSRSKKRVVEVCGQKTQYTVMIILSYNCIFFFAIVIAMVLVW